MYSPKYLVCVTSNNNNKYYKMIPNGSSWTAEYGRIGATSTTVTYSYDVWNKKYNEKIKKGYVDQTDLVEDLIQSKSSGDSLRAIENKAIAEIVSRLQKMAKRAINDNYTISANKVTKAMIEEAQRVITSLMEANSVVEFNYTLTKLFTVIPRKMKNVKDFLATSSNDFENIIKKEQDLLDIMAGQVYTKIEEAEENESVNPLEALGIKFEECTDEDIKKIKELLGDCAHKFKNAWRVTNNRTQERFDKFVKDNGIYTTKLLFHGSRNENWWSIINSGLVLKPTNAVITGKMFGYGIYYATKARKSLGYTSLSGSYWANGTSSSGFMALMDVACGKPYNVYSFDSKYYKFNYDKLQEARAGANCLYAHEGTMLRNDEIVVYKEEQCTIKYLIELA